MGEETAVVVWVSKLTPVGWSAGAVTNVVAAVLAFVHPK
jgi:hypothetical protein